MIVRLLLAAALALAPVYPAPEPCSYCLEKPVEPGENLCDGCDSRLNRP